MRLSSKKRVHCNSLYKIDWAKINEGVGVGEREKYSYSDTI